MKKRNVIPMENNDSRRRFLKNSLTTAVGFYIVPRHVLGRGFVAPSDKLVIAGVGAGGKGESDINNFMTSICEFFFYVCLFIFIFNAF